MDMPARHKLHWSQTTHISTVLCCVVYMCLSVCPQFAVRGCDEVWSNAASCLQTDVRLDRVTLSLFVFCVPSKLADTDPGREESAGSIWKDADKWRVTFRTLTGGVWEAQQSHRIKSSLCFDSDGVDHRIFSVQTCVPDAYWQFWEACP